MMTTTMMMVVVSVVMTVAYEVRWWWGWWWWQWAAAANDDDEQEVNCWITGQSPYSVAQLFVSPFVVYWYRLVSDQATACLVVQVHIILSVFFTPLWSV